MLLIKNGHIKTMAEKELENGCVLIGDDGKIACRAEECKIKPCPLRRKNGKRIKENRFCGFLFLQKERFFLVLFIFYR